MDGVRCEVDLPKVPIQTCYIKRGDLNNLDVNFIQIHDPPRIKTVLHDDQTKLHCKISQESYDVKSDKFLTTFNSTLEFRSLLNNIVCYFIISIRTPVCMHVRCSQTRETNYPQGNGKMVKVRYVL